MFPFTGWFQSRPSTPNVFDNQQPLSKDVQDKIKNFYVRMEIMKGKDTDNNQNLSTTFTFTQLIQLFSDAPELMSLQTREPESDGNYKITFSELNTLIALICERFSIKLHEYTGFDEYTNVRKGWAQNPDWNLLMEKVQVIFQSLHTEFCDRRMYQFLLFTIFWYIAHDTLTSDQHTILKDFYATSSRTNPSFDVSHVSYIEKLNELINDGISEFTTTHFWSLYEREFHNATCSQLKKTVVEYIELFINSKQLNGFEFHNLLFSYDRALLQQTRTRAHLTTSSNPYIRELINPLDVIDSVLDDITRFTVSRDGRVLQKIFDTGIRNIESNTAAGERMRHDMDSSSYHLIRLQDLFDRGLQVNLDPLNESQIKENSVKLEGLDDTDTNFHYAQVFDDCGTVIWDPASLFIYYIIKVKKGLDIYSPAFHYIVVQYTLLYNTMEASDTKLKQVIDTFFRTMESSDESFVTFSAPIAPSSTRTTEEKTEKKLDNTSQQASLISDPMKTRMIDLKIKEIIKLTKKKKEDRGLQDYFQQRINEIQDTIHMSTDKNFKELIHLMVLMEGNSLSDKDKRTIDGKIDNLRTKVLIDTGAKYNKHTSPPSNSTFQTRRSIRLPFTKGVDYIRGFNAFTKEIVTRLGSGPDSIAQYFVDIYRPLLQKLANKFNETCKEKFRQEMGNMLIHPAYPNSTYTSTTLSDSDNRSNIYSVSDLSVDHKGTNVSPQTSNDSVASTQTSNDSVASRDTNDWKKNMLRTIEDSVNVNEVD